MLSHLVSRSSSIKSSLSDIFEAEVKLSLHLKLVFFCSVLIGMLYLMVRIDGVGHHHRLV